MSDDQLIPYLAGFFDGEGCIYAWDKEGKGSCYLQIEVGQKIPDPLYLFAVRYGGRVRLNRPVSTGYTLYKWTCPSNSLELFLRELLPFLIVKAAQAKLALQLRSMIKQGVNQHTCDDRAIKLDIARQIRAAKK